jgi:hypothetical protein
MQANLYILQACKPTSAVEHPGNNRALSGRYQGATDISLFRPCYFSSCEAAFFHHSESVAQVKFISKLLGLAA